MTSSYNLASRGCTNCKGDFRDAPELVNVVPGKQYLNAYAFFTDPTYSETNLVFVRTAGRGGFVDVTLDSAGALSGWQPIGSGGNYGFTRLDLVRDNFEAQGDCQNGGHQANSALAFTVRGWRRGSGDTELSPRGWASIPQGVSYAYP